jgi:hypothetical protein
MQDAASLGHPARRLAEDLLGEPHDVQRFTMHLARAERKQRHLIEEGAREWSGSALLPKLRLHLALDAHNVELCPVALGAEPASRRFALAPHREASGLPNLGRWSIVGAGLREGGLEVSFLTLGDFLAERGVDRLHFVEADIEGGELDLRRGARHDRRPSADLDDGAPRHRWRRARASRGDPTPLCARPLHGRASARSRGRTSPALPARAATCRRSSI